jgi:hypothetical protein
VRLRLVGYSGPRPPVPGTEVVSPEDPGPIVDPTPPPDEIPPPLIVEFHENADFHKADYLAMGYNRFDVMCIGAAGGFAGAFRQTIPDTVLRNQNYRYGDHVDYLYFDSYRFGFGGAGGGGGVHRIKGRLALLPTVCPVVVGDRGADGAYFEQTTPQYLQVGPDGYIHPETYPAVPAVAPGGDGGASSFGGVICRASGGKGGIGFNGGAGGIGNQDVAGGGPWPAYTEGARDPVTGQLTGSHQNSGSWDGKIGAGGAGGQGQVSGSVHGNYATGGYGGLGALPPDGAPGAYSAADPSTSGPGGLGENFEFDYNHITSEIIYGSGNPYASGYNILEALHYLARKQLPAGGGGAKAFLLNGDLVKEYGSRKGHSPNYGSLVTGRPFDLSSDPDGVVIVRLSYAIV